MVSKYSSLFWVVSSAWFAGALPFWTSDEVWSAWWWEYAICVSPLTAAVGSSSFLWCLQSSGESLSDILPPVSVLCCSRWPPQSGRKSLVKVGRPSPITRCWPLGTLSHGICSSRMAGSLSSSKTGTIPWRRSVKFWRDTEGPLPRASHKPHKQVCAPWQTPKPDMQQPTMGRRGMWRFHPAKEDRRDLRLPPSDTLPGSP